MGPAQLEDERGGLFRVNGISIIEVGSWLIVIISGRYRSGERPVVPRNLASKRRLVTTNHKLPRGGFPLFTIFLADPLLVS